MRLLLTWVTVGALSAICVVGLPLPAPLFAAETAPAPATLGWRQNWTGRFPEATPPTNWSRTISDALVKQLRTQPESPRSATNTQDSAAIPDGLLLSFMAAGPYDAKDPAAALTEETQASEADLTPADGKLAWRKLTQDRPSYLLWDVSPAPLQRVLGKPKPGQVAYAHAYVHAPRNGKAALMLDHSGGCRLWVNGKDVYICATSSVAVTTWQESARARFNALPQPRSARIVVELTNGWNRLLFKVASSDGAWGDGWAILPRFTEVDAPRATRDQNIRWAAPLPDAANAGPLLVGDRVLVTAEPDELICVRKSDGHPLWRRLNNYYEATARKDREKNPLFNDMRDLSAQISIEESLDRRTAIQRQIRDLLLKVSANSYTIEEDPGLRQFAVNRFASAPPCSDGKFVYVWFTHGVAACYDLEGQRQWIRRVDEMVKGTKEKYAPVGAPGAVLTGGRFIVWHRETVALDAATGEIAWRQPRLPISLGATPVNLAGQDAVIGVGGVLRAADGAILWENRNRSSGQSGGTFGDNLLFMPGGTVMVAADFSIARGDKLVPSMMSATIASATQLVSRATDFSKAGDRRDLYPFSAPLAADGLVYQVDNEGMLYVLQSKPLRLVYRQLLPLEPAVCIRSRGVCAPLALAGGNLYAMDNQGTTVVFAPGRTYQQVAVNRIESFVDRSNAADGWQDFCTYGAPVFDSNCIYVRGERTLFCIGAP